MNFLLRREFDMCGKNEDDFADSLVRAAWFILVASIAVTFIVNSVNTTPKIPNSEVSINESL